MTKLLEVAVAAPIAQTLTYRLSKAENVPERLSDLVGRRVMVPLGARMVTGYVLGEAAACETEFIIKKIRKVLDTAPLFPANLIPFFRWIAAYYHFPIGETIRTALPAGLAPKPVTIIRLKKGGEQKQAVVETLPDAPWKRELVVKGELSVAQSKEVLADSRNAACISELVEKNILVLSKELRPDAVREKNEECFSLCCPLPGYLQGDKVPDREMVKQNQDVAQQCFGTTLKLSETKTLYFIQRLGGDDENAVPGKELRKAYSGASAVLPHLIELGLVAKEQRRIFRSPLGERLARFPVPERLTPDQERVLDIIIPALAAKKYQTFLLHGVTGSGKTEVYLQAAQATLDEGRDVLIIVPEITIATQLEAQFVSRFGEKVVLQHSGLSQAERFDQYYLALCGKARIVIGARSAVFAPLADPGLIVVDEEHDSSLKQDDSLRYNGRDLAVVRARKNNAVVILGSATPSVVSYQNATSGKYQLIRLPQRIGEKKLPEVHLIDLKEKKYGDKKSLFRPALEDALRENLNNKEQSVILLNRRGYAASEICQECGEPVQCRNCNVSLTRHQESKTLLCHYCGYSIYAETVCSHCGSFSFVSVGIGTERVEQELVTMFPKARIARLDADTGRNRKMLLRLIKEMRDGDIDILVGTQMIAKGLHFPGVTLVGIVWADGGLAIPDFRAAEKTFQLVTQVTGRAGRGEKPGKVFIQTMRPNHYAIALAARHQYEKMVETELELRSSPEYPPFVRLVAVHVRGGRQERVQKCCAKLLQICTDLVKKQGLGVEILGPAPAPIDRIKNRYRWQILLKSSNIDQLHQLAAYVQEVERSSCGSGCQVILDVDPENLM